MYLRVYNVRRGTLARLFAAGPIVGAAAAAAILACKLLDAALLIWNS